MLDYILIFKIAGAGIILFILDKVLKGSGKEEFGAIANLAGIIMVLIMILSLLADLFNSVKTMFMF